MASYLSLVNWTDQGVKDAKHGPERLDAIKQAAKDAGGRLIFFYMTLGEYDFAALLELPDDQTATRFLVKLSEQGNVRTKTLKAFTEDEYRQIIGGI